MSLYVVIVWNQASGRPFLPPHSVVYDFEGDARDERDLLQREYVDNGRLEQVEVRALSPDKGKVS